MDILSLFNVDDKEYCRCIMIYLSFIPDYGIWDDNWVLGKMVDAGCDKIISWYIIGMIPLFVGRKVLHGTGVTPSDELILLDKTGKNHQSIKMSVFPLYRVIEQQWETIQKHKNLQTILQKGSEINCVNDMLNNGSKPHNIVLSAPCFVYPSI